MIIATINTFRAACHGSVDGWSVCARLGRKRCVALWWAIGLGAILLTATPVAANVIISEIMYNADGSDNDREWVELYNTGTSDVDLGGWQLGDSQDGTYATPFPAGTMLGPSQALVVTGSAAEFDSQWGLGIDRIEVGNFPTLANSPSPTNETVAIRDNVGVLRDSVNYDDENDWQPVTGSFGQSIFALPSGLSTSANDLGTNWLPSMWGVYGGRFISSGGNNHASPGLVDAVSQTPFTPTPGALWSMAVVPDTQNYVKNSAHTAKLDQMIQWIHDNRSPWNIQVALHEGDIVNNNDNNNPSGSQDQTGTQQWQNARNSLSILDGQLPYIMATGNHDYGTTNAQNRSTQFNNFFTAADNPLVDPAMGGILKGVMETGSLENAYYEFTAPDGRNMLIFSLEWGPRQVAVDWANRIAGQAKYADFTTVLMTHAYMNHDETRYDWTVRQDGGNPHAYPTAPDTNDGEELWNELVKQHSHFEMTLNGHVGGDGVAYLASVGDQGNTVHQMLFNTQFETNGGDGWIRILEFLGDGRTVRVRTFSTLYGLNRTDPANDFTFHLSPLFIDGDYDHNGIVDAADYTVWRDSLGSTTMLAADGNGDGVVNQGDYAIWKANYGTVQSGVGAGGSAAAVPEPTIAWLVLLGAGCCIGGVRRKRSIATRQHQSIKRE